MTDPRGYQTSFNISSNGYLAQTTSAVGQPEQQQTVYTRDSSTNLVTSILDSLSRITAYTYDALANVASITQLSGTPGAVTTSFTYGVFSQISSVTDPLGHTWTMTLDNHGNATRIVDPSQHEVDFTYNSGGQIATSTDGVGNVFSFSYDPSSGDLVSITDPLGNVSYRFSDPVGRLIWTQDPIGNTTNMTYTPLGDLSRTIDALGNVTTFGYDPDAELHPRDRCIGKSDHLRLRFDGPQTSRTDALNATENYQYDGNGNVSLFTDRRGKITAYSYDGLNRQVFVGYGQNGSSYESTVVNTFDAGDRLTQAVDSITGTIVRTYDLLDQLTDEQTPQGEVSYEYDAAGRRQSMLVAGQTGVSYTFDNANRLTGITQGSNSVAFSYDNANRRTSLTLPNGIVVGYTYYADSHLKDLTWTQSGGTQIGNLHYTYDAAGRVTGKSGTMANTNLPTAIVVPNTFNADNEMTSFNGQAMSYDANGNLTNDGANSYSWDARNHLTGISGTNSATFAYDPFGRRASKTINSTSTQFLYDGQNPVQELQGGTPSANILTGLRMDEYLNRTDSSGSMSFLTDNLGSTLSLTDSSGNLSTNYTYDPFGNVTAGGSLSTNPYQFTGRENDGTGLDYYRARFYGSSSQRFMSQDPLEFSGGDVDLYSYTGDQPTSRRDPGGTQSVEGICETNPEVCDPEFWWNLAKGSRCSCGSRRRGCGGLLLKFEAGKMDV
jgi:RHS repeat-associated protein